MATFLCFNPVFLTRGEEVQILPAAMRRSPRISCNGRQPKPPSKRLLENGCQRIGGSRKSQLSCSCCGGDSKEGGLAKEVQSDMADHNEKGVEIALSLLRFYKSEISPFLPRSCRFVPSCSEYSMQAYEKYGVLKGTVLTAWRLCRCNPLGGSGFDPPRWFDETKPPSY